MWFLHAILPIGLFFAAQYFYFDVFSSVMLAATGLFLSLFISAFSRYQRIVGVGKAGERAVQDILSAAGVEALHDVYLPTPKGSTQLDHIALFPGSLMVIETKTYNGRLDLSDIKNYWHRLYGRSKRFPIKNPLWQMEAARKVLSQALPGVRIWGIVVLAGKYTATNNYHPKNVVSIGGLPRYLAGHRFRHGEWQFSDHILDTWTRPKALQKEHAPLGKNHVVEARRKRGKRFFFLEDAWPLWLWGSLATEAGIICILALHDVI